MLVLTRKKQETIRIGDDITITVLRIKGKSVRLGIEAPLQCSVLRGELTNLDGQWHLPAAKSRERTDGSVPPATRLRRDPTTTATPRAARLRQDPTTTATPRAARLRHDPATTLAPLQSLVRSRGIVGANSGGAGRLV